MINNNTVAYSIKIISESFRDLLYFPAWWYSLGLWDLLLKLKQFIKNRYRANALDVWIKNIFRPMYGQYDWQGRIISFFMRLIQIIYRSIIFLFWLIAALAVLIIWLVLPPFVIFEIIIQIM